MYGLKPTEFNVDGKYIKLDDYDRLVRKKIKTRQNEAKKSSDVHFYDVVLSILDAKSGTKINVNGVSDAGFSEIKNYFAEVAGPILVYKNKLFPEGKLTSTSSCFFSSSQTETLYDFKLKTGKKEFLFSNKQLKGGTNTLKPVDVVNAISKNKILKEKWQNTRVFKTFKVLNDNNVIAGPITAVMLYYSDKVPGVTKDDMKKVISQMTKNDVRILNPPRSIMSMVNKDPSVKANVRENGYLSGTAVNFMFEKILVNISAENDDYNELFLDVTEGNVVFFKFDLAKNGLVTYEISDPRKSKKKAKLRSKQGVERRSSKGTLKLDKLGFQP